MAIPPQFLKHGKKNDPEGKNEPGDSPAEDSAEGDTRGKKAPHKGAPKRDSKDPKGAAFDAIPSGPLKGKNPNDIHKKGSNAKRTALLAQLRGK